MPNLDLSVCMKKQDITGVIPGEIAIIAGKPTPTPRRRIGTAFAPSPKLFSPDNEVGI